MTTRILERQNTAQGAQLQKNEQKLFEKYGFWQGLKPIVNKLYCKACGMCG